MDKIIKCLLLKVDTVLISEIEQEFPQELGEPDCKLINPYEIDVEGNLTPWPKISEQTELKIHSDSILTIVDPKKDVIDKYIELTSK